MTGASPLSGSSGAFLDQDRAMRQTLNELAMLSYGTTASYNSSGGGSDDGDGRPKGGDTRPLHEVFAHRFNAAVGFTDREAVLDAAREALQAERVSRADFAAEESAEDLTARIRGLRAQGWPVKDVARECKCTERRVKQADRDTDVARVLDLLAAGWSVRSIAMKTGKSKSDVGRITKKAA